MLVKEGPDIKHVNIAAIKCTLFEINVKRIYIDAIQTFSRHIPSNISIMSRKQVVGNFSYTKLKILNDDNLFILIRYRRYDGVHWVFTM